MLRHCTAILTTLLVASAGYAADPSLHHDHIPIGATIDNIHNDHVRETLVYLGPRDGSFVFIIKRGSTYGRSGSTIFHDAQGNTHKVVHANGGVVTYTPHNCVRVLGTCRYSVTYANGNMQQFQRTTQAEGDNFVAELVLVRGDGALVPRATARFTLHEDGVVEWSQTVTPTGRVLPRWTTRRSWVEGDDRQPPPAAKDRG